MNQTICLRPPKSLMMAAVEVVVKGPAGAKVAMVLAMDELVMTAG